MEVTGESDEAILLLLPFKQSQDEPEVRPVKLH